MGRRGVKANNRIDHMLDESEKQISNVHQRGIRIKLLDDVFNGWANQCSEDILMGLIETDFTAGIYKRFINTLRRAKKYHQNQILTESQLDVF